MPSAAERKQRRALTAPPPPAAVRRPHRLLARYGWFELFCDLLLFNFRSASCSGFVSAGRGTFQHLRRRRSYTVQRPSADGVLTNSFRQRRRLIAKSSAVRLCSYKTSLSIATKGGVSVFGIVGQAEGVISHVLRGCRLHCAEAGTRVRAKIAQCRVSEGRTLPGAANCSCRCRLCR